MYFSAPRGRFAEGVIACWEQFLGRFGGRLTWYENTRRRIVGEEESPCRVDGVILSDYLGLTVSHATTRILRSKKWRSVGSR
jgi:hypothetical protein